MTSILDSPLPADVAEFVGRVSTLLTAAPLGVAFSGGVDSSVLLALAVRTLGPDQVVAILGVSPSLGTDDRQTAHKVAAYIGARLVEVQTREGEANGLSRQWTGSLLPLQDGAVQSHRAGCGSGLWSGCGGLRRER